MTQAIANRSASPLARPVSDKATLESLISGENFQRAVKDILPSHLKIERILKMAFVATSRQPGLFKCTQLSFVSALMKSAELGLDCSGTLGEGYMVPFWNSTTSESECQFIPGYRGIIKLAKQANDKMQIEARVVYENDVFEYEYGLTPKLIHKPTMGEGGEIVYFYCISREPGLQPEFTVMTRSEVDAIKLRSKSRNRQGQLVGPWVSDYAEMGRKTIVKRHAKYLSLSVEVHEAVAADDEQYRTGHELAVAAEVGKGVGLNAMKERMQLVKNGGEEVSEDGAADAAPSGDAVDAANDDVNLPDVSGYEEAVDEDPDETAEREAIATEARGEQVGMTPEERAELELYELRRDATEAFRDLKTSDPARYTEASKFLGNETISDMTRPKATEFLKRFAG